MTLAFNTISELYDLSVEVYTPNSGAIRVTNNGEDVPEKIRQARSFSLEGVVKEDETFEAFPLTRVKINGVGFKFQSRTYLDLTGSAVTINTLNGFFVAQGNWLHEARPFGIVMSYEATMCGTFKKNPSVDGRPLIAYSPVLNLVDRLGIDTRRGFWFADNVMGIEIVRPECLIEAVSGLGREDVCQEIRKFGDPKPVSIVKPFIPA